jgi:hypothetical protein
MPLVAGLTVNIRFVGGTIRFDLGRLLIMTLDAIIRRQHDLLSQGTNCAPSKKQSNTQYRNR